MSLCVPLLLCSRRFSARWDCFFWRFLERAADFDIVLLAGGVFRALFSTSCCLLHRNFQFIVITALPCACVSCLYSLHTCCVCEFTLEKALVIHRSQAQSYRRDYDTEQVHLTETRLVVRWELSSNCHSLISFLASQMLGQLGVRTRATRAH